jgi:protein O-GlcNAc transferase
MTSNSPAYLAARKLYDEGRLDEARASLQRSLQRSPADADLNLLMGAVMMESGAPEGGLYFLERASAASPGSATIHAVLGECRIAAGKLDGAEKSLRRAIELSPDEYSSRINLANICIKAGRFDEAETLLRAAAALRPDRFDAVNNLALLLLDCGRADEAAAMVRARASASPADPMVHRCLANILNFVPEESPGESIRAHRVFGEALARSASAARQSLPAFANSRDPDRRIRVAYMSPDFREHSVASFVAPILRGHDRSAFEVFAYSSTSSPDARTERLKASADHWRDISRTGDVAVARQMRSDAIDILIDLAGLTNNHRLGVLALGGAPIQMTYCGYPNTTGLPTVHYRIVDAMTDPPGSESSASERLLRLSGPGSFSCFEPPTGMPAPAEFDSSRPITFGSFNVLSKVTPSVVRVWSDVLKSVPDSRLILKARSLASEVVKSRYARAFESCGIEPGRVELLGPVPSAAEHLAVYSRLAVALDPVPYNGTTTTYEALWMGVPVLTLAGSTHAGRVGASILTSLGLHDLIASSTEDYVERAAALSRDSARLAGYRRTLRDRLASSALCDAGAFMSRYESALRGVWRDWCLAVAPSR